MKFKHCPAKSPIIQIEDRTCSRQGHHQGLDGCSWMLRFTMVCSFRLFHTSWTSGPVNDWYHTCKFTGHVVFNMGSSNLAAATFENNFNWKAVHAPVLNKHYSCQIRSHLSSAKTLFHKLLNLQCTFSPVHARHSDIQKHQKGLCDVALSCHGMDFIAMLAALGCRGFSRTSSPTIHPSQSFFSSWSNLESPSKSNFNDFNGFNIFQKNPSFNIFNLSIGPLPNGTPTATAVNHRPSILVLEAREVL